MQKYLLKDQKAKQLKPSSQQLANFSNLRSQLQCALPITKEFISKVIQQNRLAAIRQILYFGRYQQFKKIISQFCSQQQLLGNLELAELIHVNKCQKQNKAKQNDREKKFSHAPVQNGKRNRLIRNSIITIVGVLLGILCIIKRQKLKQLVKKILV